MQQEVKLRGRTVRNFNRNVLRDDLKNTRGSRHGHTTRDVESKSKVKRRAKNKQEGIGINRNKVHNIKKNKNCV